MRVFNVLVALLFAGILSLSGQSVRKPNIVLIFADDMGFMDVGYNGADFYETPNIDKFAKQNLVFSNAYAGGANCVPSRAALMSGQYSPRTGVYAVGTTNRGPVKEMRLMPVPNTAQLSPENFTMAKALKRAGYRTGIFGKWHIGSKVNKNDPKSMGFDVAMDNNGDPKLNVVKDPKAMFEIADSAINFMEANKDKPFFAYIAHHAIHSNHQTTAATLAKFKAKAPGKLHDKPILAGCIYDFDATVGKVLHYLKENGLENNTLIVFTSDNGGTNASSQEPLRGNKGAYYEGGIKVPFIVRWAGKTKAGINAEPIINLDLYPTFASLAGLKLPQDKVLDGEDLLPLFAGQRANTSRKNLYWHFPGYLDNPVHRGRDTVFRTRPVTTMRKGDYKILLYHEEWVQNGGYGKRNSNNALELYNLKTDAGEYKNLAMQQPKKRDELLADMLSWMKKTNAKLAMVRTPEQEAMRLNSEIKIKKNKIKEEDDD